MKEKLIYDAPEVELLDMSLERGFLTTSNVDGVSAESFGSYNDDQAW